MAGDDDSGSDVALPQSEVASPGERDNGEMARARQGDPWVSSAYFKGYGSLSLHAVMVADTARVGAYAAAMRSSRSEISGRVVLDVGAGCGILSLLAATVGGALRVYAVEATAAMAEVARELVIRNDLGDKVVVMLGLMGEVELPEKVDVLISEWMGFYLLHESMLDSVLCARDSWLKPGGLILPSSARLWGALVDAEDLKIEVEGFSSVCGLDLGLLGRALMARRSKEPQIETVQPCRLISSPALALDLGDLGQLPVGRLGAIEASLRFVALRDGAVAGLALWFDAGFKAHGDCEALVRSAASIASSSTPPIRLSTGPGDPPTHWKQTVVYFGVFKSVEAGQVLDLDLKLKQNQTNPRQYDITVET